MDRETIAMSQTERTRMMVLEAVKRREITLSEAARRMGLSRRQAFRLKARYLAGGAGGIVHRSRGRPGNRDQPLLRQEAVALYREAYGDFGPTLAAEKMLERDGLAVHPETLRRWLLASGDWLGRQRRRVHRRRRKRRERFGELLQIDGSDHAWFEERGPTACLMVMVDDATARMKLFMAPEETTHAALVVVRKWVEPFGVPEAIYADRKTLYWSPTALDRPQLRDRREVHSEWGRVAVGNLGIELIPAYSPQAKGRVERRNGLLQDRLVKELRLRGIDTIEGANAMLDAFAEEMFERFGVEPADPRDAHRVFAPADREACELAFSIDKPRTVARDNTVVLGRRCWQIAAQPGAPRPGAKVVLWRAMDGQVRCRWQGRDLKIRRFDPKAERFRRRCGLEPADPPPPTSPAAGPALGDPSPRPPGIDRIRAKAGAENKKDGTARDDRPTPASASGAALGSRPRVALSSDRSKA